MEESFSELVDAVKRNRKHCHRISKTTTEEHVKELMAEAQEVLEAVEKKDWENLQEELGDLLWDIVHLILIAESEGRIDSGKVIRGVLDKMKERKPHIFDGRTVLPEESRRVFDEAKKRQKARRQPL